MKIPKKISEKIVADNGFRKTIEKIFEFENGKKGNFLIASHYGTKDAILAIPLTKNDEIIYIKEYRYGVEDHIIQFPMGAVDDSTITIENTVIKELKEETGYLGNAIIYLGETIVANYEKSISKYYLIKNCKKVGNQELENGENIEVFISKIDDFEKMILSGKVMCPLTIAGFYLAKNKGYIQ